MPRPIHVRIDSAALSHNLGQVFGQLRLSAASATNLPKVWAVIKANAYGHGIEVAVNAFAQADGLAMLDFEEAVRCREAGWRKPILMLEGVFEPDDLLACAQWDLWPVIHDSVQIGWLQNVGLPATAASRLQVFMKLDTGMHRLGFSPQAYPQAFAQLQALQTQGKIAAVAHMTHFACADEAAGIEQPLQIFRETVGPLPGVRCVANSAAILRHTDEILALHQTPQTGHPQSEPGSWVRPGICLYGASPLPDASAEALGLKPAMALMSQVIGVKTVRAGESVGYSAQYRAQQDTKVAVVACGYADGYPRHAPNGTPVMVKGQRASLAGRVSMDMLAVDVTAISDVQIGDPVILWGEGGPSVDEVAQASGTIGYTLLTGVTARVRRQVV